MNSTLLYLLGIVILLVGVGVSIALHELGHLLPAKKFNVPVSKYMVGFGPTLWSRKRGETEYGIKLIPLGGYISMAGMVPPGNDKAPKNWFQKWVADSRRTQQQADGTYDGSRAFYRLPIHRRIIIMLGGPFANLVLGIVFMMIALSGLGIMSLTTSVKDVVACVTDYESAPASCKASDIASPAKVAGMIAGDRVLSVNGQQIDAWSQFQERIDASGGKPLELLIQRGTQEIKTSVTPVRLWRPVFDSQTGAAKLDADGKQVFEKRYVIGVLVKYERQPLSIANAASFTWSTLAGTAEMVIHLPQKLGELASSTFGPAARPLDAPVSLVGVGNIAGNIASDSELSVESKVVSGLLMLGSLNFALFVFNLIPLLPLDGGHVLNALYEGVKRLAFRVFRKRDPGPFDTAKLMPFTSVMWLALLALGVFVMIADVVKPVSL